MTLQVRYDRSRHRCHIVPVLNVDDDTISSQEGMHDVWVKDQLTAKPVGVVIPAADRLEEGRDPALHLEVEQHAWDGLLLAFDGDEQLRLNSCQVATAHCQVQRRAISKPLLVQGVHAGSLVIPSVGALVEWRVGLNRHDLVLREAASAAAPSWVGICELAVGIDANLVDHSAQQAERALMVEVVEGRLGGRLTGPRLVEISDLVHVHGASFLAAEPGHVVEIFGRCFRVKAGLAGRGLIALITARVQPAAVAPDHLALLASHVRARVVLHACLTAPGAGHACAALDGLLPTLQREAKGRSALRARKVLGHAKLHGLVQDRCTI
eukprot:scaffold43197_cov66-Phaeocystis_antarctica.AAC.2